MIVFDDVDITDVVNGTVFGSFIASGQTCIAGSRLLIQKGIYDKFVDKFVEKVKNIKVGDPLDNNTQMGPVISEQQLNKIDKMVKNAKKEGAKVLCGGNIINNQLNGYYYEPTVLEVEPHMEIFQEEVFGPVVVVHKFTDEKNAIELANNSEYGLGASIWTNNIKIGHRIADNIDAGIIWINDHHKNDPCSPWGGFKNSGIGRENGIEAFHEYTQTKSIIVNYSASTTDWFSNSNSNIRYS